MGRKISFFLHVMLRNMRGSYSVHKPRKGKKNYKLLGMIRMRNEALILKDSLDHLAQFVDGIVVFDDKSTDESREICVKHPAVIEVISNKRWRKNRTWEETANRRLLYQRTKKYKPTWLFYMDADERFEGDIRGYLESEESKDVTAIKITLLDAYITQEDKEDYIQGQELYNFRKRFGPEKRDILMIWRNMPGVDFRLPDSREPQGMDEQRLVTKFYCQHYGKSLSIQHWEDTCRYYIENFPQYSEKWKLRLGKAVHSESDFGARLYSWKDAKKKAYPL